MEITQIKGQILGENNEPLLGATILKSNSQGKSYKATPDGVVSNFSDAKFSINVNPTETDLYLKVQYMGYKNLIIPVDFRENSDGFNIMNFNLVQDNKALPQVEIVADSLETECKKKGGVYNKKTKSCVIVPKSPKVEKKSTFEKYKWYIVGTGVFIATLTIAIVLAKNSNKNK
jgi:hypothetical protein